jgi:hypothetical protein
VLPHDYSTVAVTDVLNIQPAESALFDRIILIDACLPFDTRARAQQCPTVSSAVDRTMTAIGVAELLGSHRTRIAGAQDVKTGTAIETGTGTGTRMDDGMAETGTPFGRGRGARRAADRLRRIAAGGSKATSATAGLDLVGHGKTAATDEVSTMSNTMCRDAAVMSVLKSCLR